MSDQETPMHKIPVSDMTLLDFMAVLMPDQGFQCTDAEYLMEADRPVKNNMISMDEFRAANVDYFAEALARYKYIKAEAMMKVRAEYAQA